MSLSYLFDPNSAAIVLIGSIGASALRCGVSNARVVLRIMGNLFVRPFDGERVRSELAVQIQEIDSDGLIRAEPHQFGDGEFDHLSATLVRHRSIEAMHAEHDRYRSQRSANAAKARNFLEEATELATVMGLAGTLIALGGLAASDASPDFAQAIGGAVTTTLYGLIAANFLFAPLAALVERRAQAEESERQALLDWLEDALKVDRSRPRNNAASRVAA